MPAPLVACERTVLYVEDNPANLALMQYLLQASGYSTLTAVDGREGVDHMKGFFLKVTVLGDVTPDMEIFNTEVFGPVVCLAKADSLDTAIDPLRPSTM